MVETPSLHDTLIEAGMALLEEGGIAGLTLRRAAARAGVSHAAPAHHFAGLPGLLTAIAGRAFALFVQAMERKIAAAPTTPEARLTATCQGYLDFATDHSGLFHVMFQSPEVRRDDPALLPQSRRAYELLRDACQPFAPSDAPDPAFEVAVWGLVHGYAMLGFAAEVGQHRGVLVVPSFEACLAGLMEGRHAETLAPSGEMR